MLKDITIGQHFPGHSVLHRCDPPVKAGCHHRLHHCAVYRTESAGAGALDRPFGAALPHRPHPRQDDFENLKPIVPIILFTAVLNLFFVTGQGSRWCISGC